MCAARWALLAGLVLVLVAPVAAAQLALPHTDADSLNSPGDELTYTIDLGTLPTRPVLVVEVTPEASQLDGEFEIELTDFVNTSSGPGFTCPDESYSIASTPTVGPVELRYSFITCDPQPGAFAGGAVTVRVRAENFGSGGGSADVSVVIRAETLVPTRTLTLAVENDLTPQSLAVSAAKDTTIYSRFTDRSNGAGGSMWAGTDVWVFPPPLQITVQSPLRSLFAFDFVESLPFNAEIQDAEIRLWANSVKGGGGFVSLYKTSTAGNGVTWAEGNADAEGEEFEGEVSAFTAADWIHRTQSTNPWNTLGGDVDGAALDSVEVTTFGYRTFEGPMLDDAVQQMVDEQSDEDGFTLRGPGNSIFNFIDQGVRFLTRESTFQSLRPTLTVEYAPAAPYVEGDIQPGVVSFINEGEDFRWLYDTDQNDIYVTEIGGVCIANPFSETQVNFVPYTYEFTGTPGFVGVDCCTWQITSSQTGTVGTGQALFFHNLDPADPANLPPDSDGDGILDLCDNCMLRANGPVLGTCVDGAGVTGASCHSAQECATGETCSLSQEDADLDFFGDVCAAPEPSFGLSVGLGVALLGDSAAEPESCGLCE